MAQLTEAACLLQSGAMYPRRIGLRTRSGADIFAGVKPGGVSVYFGDSPIYHFDLDGRWQRAFVGEAHFLKGLDSIVHSIDREREGIAMVLRRRTLPFGQAVDLDASIRTMALDLIDDLDSGSLEFVPVPDRARPLQVDEFRTFLDRVAGWDSTAWFAHRERYLGTYGPMPFLPTDCPGALVVQASLGHSGGRAFGRARPFEHYLRSPKEFDEHCQAVKRLVGRRLSQFNRIFLAGADVLHQPITVLEAYFDRLWTHFVAEPPIPTGETQWDEFQPSKLPVQVMLDDLNGPLPGPDDWRRLARAGLTRVTIGVESGDSMIRSTYGKTWTNDSLRSAIDQIHQAGISVGLILLVGVGGRSVAESHLAATLAMLEILPLGGEDLVTLVDARSLDASPLDERLPLTDGEVESEIQRLKAWRSGGGPSKRPKVVAYNPDKQPG